MLCSQSRDGCGRGLLLSWRMIKNHRAILRSEVRTLPIQLRRIMLREKCFEQMLITHTRRIERDLQNFRVAGSIGADIVVAWVANVPPS